jgi:hypothetical protein
MRGEKHGPRRACNRERGLAWGNRPNYSRARVRRLMREAGFGEVRVRALTNIFFAVGVP